MFEKEIPAETLSIVKQLLAPYGVEIGDLVTRKKVVRAPKAAEIMDCTVHHVYQLAKDRKLVAYKPEPKRGKRPGGAVYIEEQSIYDYLESGRIRPEA